MLKTSVPRDHKGKVLQEDPEEMAADDKPWKCSGRDESGDAAQTGSHKQTAVKLDATIWCRVNRNRVTN